MKTTPINSKNTDSMAGIFAMLAALATTASGQCFEPPIASPEPATNAYFGTTVATFGDWLFCDSDFHGVPGVAQAGVVYVFHRSGGAWIWSQSIHSQAPQFNGEYGLEMEVNGDWLVIGNPIFSSQGSAIHGQVDVYHRSGNTWGLFQTLFAPSVDWVQFANFGKAVAVRGNSLMVGESANGGAVLAYRWNGSSWNLEQRIANPTGDLNAQFGAAVSVDGNSLMIGAPNANTAVAHSGTAFIYRWNGSAWTVVSGISGTMTSGFMGSRVRVRGTTFASFDANAHIVRSIQAIGSGFGSVQNAGVIANCFDLSDDGRTMVTGESSPYRVSTWYFDGSNWIDEGAIVTGRNPDIYTLPTSVAIGGDHAAIGLSYDDFGGIVGAGVAEWAKLSNQGGASDCYGARLVGTGTFEGCTADGMADGVQSCDPNTTARAVWYEFAPACAGLYTIDTAGSGFDTVLSVYSACPANDSTLLACNDDAGGISPASRVQVLVTGPVKIRVGGYAGNEGHYVLNISGSSGTPNDTCGTAIVVPDSGVRFCTYSATSDGLHDLACTGSSTMFNDVWFSYTPSCSGLYEFSACDATFDSVMAVYEGGCEGIGRGPIACNDDNPFCGTHALIDVQLAGGTQYMLRLGGYGPSSVGEGYLYVSSSTTCPADFNYDGGIDGADVQDFFAAWEAGSGLADVNCDGGIDGADVGVFYAAWENGGC